MGWLSQSERPDAAPLVERLAALVFQGDTGWPQRTEWVDAYSESLSGWFAGDSAREFEFADLTRPDADPGKLIDWFLPVVQEWEQRAADAETDRYDEPAYDDAYGLHYRLDRTQQVYEWYDESTATWRDQTWADLYAAQRHESTADSPTPADAAPPEWDENWAMFYRVGPGGVYEFADATTPGDETTGCTDVWFSHEQVLQRMARERATNSQRELIRKSIPNIATLVPGFDDLSDTAIAEIVETFLQTTGGK